VNKSAGRISSVHYLMEGKGARRMDSPFRDGSPAGKCRYGYPAVGWCQDVKRPCLMILRGLRFQVKEVHSWRHEGSGLELCGKGKEERRGRGWVCFLEARESEIRERRDGSLGSGGGGKKGIMCVALWRCLEGGIERKMSLHFSWVEGSQHLRKLVPGKGCSGRVYGRYVHVKFGVSQEAIAEGFTV